LSVTCPALEMPVHGAVNCSHPSEQLTWGTTCEFTCEEGFTLTGPATLQCGSSGAWDRQQPTCAGNFLFPAPLTVRCEAVPRPAEGSVSCDRDPSELTSGSRCDFQCSEGYVLEGSSSTECLPQGQWSQPVPKCRVIQCDPLSSPENGYMDCSHGAGIFTYNTSCHFRCLEGWSLNGSRILECSYSGTWSASLPTCEGMLPCEQPQRGDGKNAKRSWWEMLISYILKKTLQLDFSSFCLAFKQNISHYELFSM
uniref:Sushi domain-containing protein n=1 Tax=Zosterops lateralis melanops TaxID=1220523 RepID=A0A8D2Q3N1_ZOSLA